MAALTAQQQWRRRSGMWDGVVELTRSAQERNSDPLSWAIQLLSGLNSAGVSLPSTEVAKLLVSHICWDNNVPITWKFLEKALTGNTKPKEPPCGIQALYGTSEEARFLIGIPNKRIMESIDDVLHLSQIFGLQACDSGSGVLVVEFVFSIVWQLLDASLDDEGLLELTPEKKSRWTAKTQDMEIDHYSFEEKRTEHHEGMRKTNTVMAIEILGELFRNKITSRILYLARRNMPIHWGCFIQHIRLLAANSPALRSSKNITPESLLQLTSDTRRVLSRECKTSSQQQFHAVMASGSLISSAGQCLGAGRSARWIPFDLFLEDTMDGSQIATTSAAETLTGLVKALQAVNGTPWPDTFLGLWIAALRLVQRERDPSEGPVPRLDTCLCLLLSIAILAIVNIIEEEENALTDEAASNPCSERVEKQAPGQRRKDLVSSLQQLGDYEGLLASPLAVSSVANQAAAKAMMFLSGLSVGSGYVEGMSLNDMPVSFAGNLRHLIVEACIARNLLDTSAYLWPGYVKGCTNQLPRNIPGQMPGWSSLMKGSPLTPPTVAALVSTPASSLAEVEKIYEIAVNGSEDEKISAATILCGASLTRGWNVQVPQLAGVLMPICEVFGSCAPKVSWTLKTGEEISPHAVFSNAFTLLLKLWKFHQPPLEHVMGDVTPVGTQLTPEYLLLVRNSQLASPGSSLKDQSNSNRLSRLSNPSSTEPIFLDSFPKLTLWLRQHQACIASTLSGLGPGTPVYQIFDGLLNMMFKKINRGGQSLTPATSGSSNSSGGGTEDSSLRLKLPAWDILEAVPFVLDAALTACAHGRLSPRELATGLKDLADFLPASLATIVSYFSAEVTRGLWKPAFMNGTDWPSPAANLSMVEQQINQILAATGVDVPSLAAGASSPATLPLPLAALVSLTITYKLDRATDRFLNLIGPALNTLGAGCPWPCMPILSSLWAQKAKRWSDFLVFSASRTVFHHNSDAVVQLLRVCFTSTLGLNSSPISNNGGVGALLGHGFGSHFSGGISPVAPGILYLRVHRSVRNVMFMTEEILSLLMHSVKDIASHELPADKLDKLKKTKYGLRYGQVSLAAAMTRVKLAASLGASLVWITGGLSLVQSLIKEALPSWFISVHGSEPDVGGGSGGMIAMLGGYALAYFAVLSGTFAWGVDSASPASKRRPHVLRVHLEFLASALEGKISLGCNNATWRAYVSGFVSLMVACTPTWMREVDVEVMKSLSEGLRQWDEEELALALLGIGGVGAMGAAAELIIDSGPEVR
ncbi:hypothetical protein RJ639_017767 [Escallonia herrerae]|uniref:Mediator of RNA polymerase II transcription subunit 33A n=1 Tax=Escallonia herrerae TaxID=1293975 RepID=A0AA88VBX7_9ASTE|nr:hypothetical protein RJ639_017767 [Escallonia herrerae]